MLECARSCRPPAAGCEKRQKWKNWSDRKSVAGSSSSMSQTKMSSSIAESWRRKKSDPQKTTLRTDQGRRTVGGTVRSLTDYGAFVDLGGVDALLHVGDIAWGRVNKPADVLSVGQQIDVRVLKAGE